MTTRENRLHNVGRGAMSTTFSVLFLYVFVTISKALNEIEESTNKTSKTINTQMKALFQRAFLEFLLITAGSRIAAVFLDSTSGVSTIARIGTFSLALGLQTIDQRTLSRKERVLV